MRNITSTQSHARGWSPARGWQSLGAAAASGSSSTCAISLDQNLSMYKSEAKRLLCKGPTSCVHGYISWSSHNGCWEQFHTDMHPGKHCASNYLVTLSNISIRQTAEPAKGRRYWMDNKTDGHHGLGVRLGLDCPSWPPAGGVTFVDMYEHRVATEFGPKADTCDKVVDEHLCALTPMDLWNVRLARRLPRVRVFGLTLRDHLD